MQLPHQFPVVQRVRVFQDGNLTANIGAGTTVTAVDIAVPAGFLSISDYLQVLLEVETDSGANDLGYDVQIVSGATATILGSAVVYSTRWGIHGRIAQSRQTNTNGYGNALQIDAAGAVTATSILAALVTADWIANAFTVRLRWRNNNVAAKNLFMRYSLLYGK